MSVSYVRNIPMSPEARSLLLPAPRREVRKRPRVADVMVSTLTALGVRTYYGIPGGSISPIYDALLDVPGARTIVSRNEGAAAFMAAGHARQSGELPVLLVTSGPGVMNALTGIASAYCDGAPMLVIAGEVPKKNFGKGAVQEGSSHTLDIVGTMRSSTKMCQAIVNGRSAGTVIRKAVATALSGRKGPVFLSLPLDVACEEIDHAEIASQVQTSFTVDERLLQLAAEALSNAKRPVFYVGNGARDKKSARLLQLLAHSLSAPVLTTPKGKGIFPESDPLSLGVFGLGGHPSATRYLEEGVDVMLAVGAGFGDTGTNGWSPLLRPREKLIQIDIDAAQIGKNYLADIGLVGKADVIIESLLTRVSRRSAPPPSATVGLERLAPEKMESKSFPLKPQAALASLQKASPKDTVFTVDIGEHQMFAVHYLSCDVYDSFMVHNGLGAMGSGFCSAMGAKLAAPERPVVAICGDCCFQMYEGELATAVQYGIGVVFAVMNDARPNMVVHGLDQVYGRGMDLSLPKVDFAKLAEAVGAKGYRIERVEDFAHLPQEVFLGKAGPVVLDIRIDPSERLPGASRAAHIGQFASKGEPKH